MVKLAVGETLFCVYDDARRGDNFELEITKVGRKWVHTGHHYRVDIETLRIDGGQYSSPGKCYLSKEDYEAEKALDLAWNDFRETISDIHRIPKYMTIAKINQARGVLGL